jgi:hypothetical protein
VWDVSGAAARIDLQNGAMRMTHDQLLTIIKRYTPTMLDVVAPAPPDDVSRLAAAAGALPDSYREFLEWMGNWCPFLEGEALAYSPADLLELVYEGPKFDVPPGLIWIGVDKSGAAFDVYLRRADGSVARAWYYEGVNEKDLLPENTSVASYLLAAYVRTTLVPSHPLHFHAAFEGSDQQMQELWTRLGEACSHFEVPYPIAHPDFRFYGGNDFVIGVHQRPNTAVVKLHFGAIDRTRYETWYDLVFARWRFHRGHER